MPKKRRATSSSNNNFREIPSPENNMKDDEIIRLARSRLKGALLDALDPNSNDSQTNSTSIKIEKPDTYPDSRLPSNVKRDLSSDLLSELLDSPYIRPDRRGSHKKRALSPHKSNSYVMKLFDRSVDLAQFKEDTPLYPICRAWMANQPRIVLRPKTPGDHLVNNSEGNVELPPPEGPPVKKIPPLLPEQMQRSNLDYNNLPVISKESLMAEHLTRWTAVRKQWLDQSVKYEARYAKSQQLLKEMDTNGNLCLDNSQKSQEAMSEE